MQCESQSGLTQESRFFSQRPVLRLLIIGFLFIAAFSIRLYHINEPLMDFHTVRQYRSAIIARGLYFETMESIPEWKKRIASINMQKERALEPQIIEHTTAFAYRIVGGEYLWIPRLLSSISWLIGGVFLYLIARKIASTGAAMFSIAFYLFLPYGISASRSFQPDSLMVMMLLFSVFTILRYDEQPSIFRLVIAAIISALAIFIKPICIFLIFGVFISLAIYRRGILKSVINPNFLIFTAISLLPFTIYMFTTGFLHEIKESSRTSFIPDLLLYPSFWRDWLTMLGQVVGYIAFIAGIIGLLIVPKGLPRALLTGLWAGYFLFGLAFNNRINTHNYYHLQFIPVVALSLGHIGIPAMNRLTNLLNTRRRAAVSGILLLALVFTTGLYIRKVDWRDINPDVRSKLEIAGSVLGINPQFIKFIKPDFEKEIRIAKEIGDVVGHSTKTLILAPDYGKSLIYYGELAGSPWPTSADFQIVRLWGRRVLSAEERFNASGRGLLIEGGDIDTSHEIKQSELEYFIVTHLRDFKKQADLRDFLTGNFPILAQKDEYLIFDLRKRPGPDKQPGK